MDKVWMSPLQYAGGKRWLFRILDQFLPEGTTSIVSPFFGGGAIEINYGIRGIKVYGYDNFKPLVDFWQYYLQRPVVCCNGAEYLVNSQTRDLFVEMHKGRFFEMEDSFTKSEMFLCLNRMAFGGMGFRAGGLVTNHKRSLKPENFKYLKAVGLAIQNVEVEHADCFESLEMHPRLFAYIDPPYPVSDGLYGKDASDHEDFDHKKFAEFLLARENCAVSYNDCELIRSLYADWQILPVKRKADARTKNKDEVLILSPDVWHRYLKLPQQLRFAW